MVRGPYSLAVAAVKIYLPVRRPHRLPARLPALHELIIHVELLHV
jgi:hypothetical protein